MHCSGDFVILMDIREDNTKERLQAIYDLSEPAGEDEANTIDLKVQTLQCIGFEHGSCNKKRLLFEIISVKSCF